MASVKPLTHLVVVGSSAGGIDALSTLVATLPSDFSAPVVIAQHIDPHRQSHLRDILERHSVLPVRTITGHEPLEPGVIFVSPPNYHISVSDHAIDLLATSTGTSRPSVDLMMTTAAEAYGDKVIAVILSGTGSDGSVGARAVKDAGGAVIIQNPDTAPYPGMPLSLAPSIVDIVANVEDIGGILEKLLTGMDLPKHPTQKSLLDTFLAQVREHYDIDFSKYKTPTILRRLQRRIVATNTNNFDSYVKYLGDHPEEYQQLVNAFLIKVTEFFRDPEMFAYLRDTVLPDIIAYARKHGNDVRIWSAGCATGEEAYSLAILVMESLGGALDHFNVRIFATDVDAQAIAYARRGIYPATALIHLPQEMIARYFVRKDGSYQINKAVRALTVFGDHDLGASAPFPRIDMAVCRNVLIYFTPELQVRTLKLFAYSVRDAGYLVLGKAESIGQLTEFFKPEHKQHKVFRRHGERLLMPPHGPIYPQTAQDSPPSATKRTVDADPPNSQQRDAGRKQRARADTQFEIPVGMVTVDQRYDIQTINNVARRMLGIFGAALGDDLIHSMKVGPTERLREAIDSAFHTGAITGIEEFAISEVTSGEQRYIQVTCHPQRADGEEGAVEKVMVVLHDITSFVRERARAEQQAQMAQADGETKKQSAEEEVVSKEHIILRLVETNRQLIEANQELTDANEELRSANEEYLVSAEEAQAATEEVETLNEELQATNEELETLNEELQATNEEVNTTNDDLNARSVELHELATASEEERTRLEVILASIGDAVLVVNAQGVVALFNEAYTRMFGIPEAEIELLDNEGRRLDIAERPQERARRGESFGMEFTALGSDKVRRWYEANGQPIQDTSNNRQLGGVVVIRDVTDERTLHRMQSEFISLASHELRTPLTPLMTALEALERRYSDEAADARTRRYIDSALVQTKRLKRLVEDLLDAARLQGGKFRLKLERVQLNDLMIRTVEEAQTMATAQTIVFDGIETPLIVQADPQRLQQVFLNLLVNAIVHAPNTQRIDVRLRCSAREAEIEVQDYGGGIATRDKAQLFSRFYQVMHQDEQDERGSSPGGLGLGLYIAREIVEAHQGTIAVDSTEGKGATFIVRLPLEQSEGGG